MEPAADSLADSSKSELTSTASSLHGSPLGAQRSPPASDLAHQPSFLAPVPLAGAGGPPRQRRSAVRYANLQEANDSPILSKANKTVEFEARFGGIESKSLVGAVASVQGWRKTMEDAHVLAFPNSTNGENVDPKVPVAAVLGVLDGHRGAQAATKAAAALLPTLFEVSCAVASPTTNSHDLSDETLRAIGDELCWAIDEKLRHPAPPVPDGCTFNTCLLVDDGRLLLLNVGDSRSYVAVCDYCARDECGSASDDDLSSSGAAAATVPISRRRKVSEQIVADAGKEADPTATETILVTTPSGSSTAVADGAAATSTDSAAAPAPCATATAAGEVQADPLKSAFVGVSIEATSTDHRTADDAEVARITAAGGFVINGRVNGKLTVTRALGDFDLKVAASADPAAAVAPTTALSGASGRPNFVVTCAPEIRVLPPPRDETFRIVLVGCDGVWERLSAAQIVDRVVPLVDAYVEAVARESECSTIGTNSPPSLAATMQSNRRVSDAASEAPSIRMDTPPPPQQHQQHQPPAQPPAPSPCSAPDHTPGHSATSSPVGSVTAATSNPATATIAALASSAKAAATSPGTSSQEALASGLRRVLADLLDHGCSPVCDQTGRAPGMDNMTLGVLIIL